MSDDLVELAHRSDGAERDPGQVCAKWFRGGLRQTIRSSSVAAVLADILPGLRHAIRTSYVAAVLAADRAPGLSAELALHLTSVGFTAADIDRLVPWVADVADVSRGDASDWWDAVGLLASSGWSAADIAAMPALKTSAYGNQFGSPAEAVRLLAYAVNVCGPSPAEAVRLLAYAVNVCGADFINPHAREDKTNG